MKTLEIDALPTRTRNVLLSYGLTTRKQVRQALRKKLLLNRLRNYGILAHNAVITWLGVQLTPQLRKCVQSEKDRIKRAHARTLARRRTEMKNAQEREALDKELIYRLHNPRPIYPSTLTASQQTLLQQGVSDLPVQRLFQ